MAERSIAEALRQAIREEMARDPRVFCIGEDIGIEGGFGGAFTVTLGLSDEFGHERCWWANRDRMVPAVLVVSRSQNRCRWEVQKEVPHTSARQDVWGAETVRRSLTPLYGSTSRSGRSSRPREACLVLQR